MLDSGPTSIHLHSTLRFDVSWKVVGFRRSMDTMRGKSSPSRLDEQAPDGSQDRGGSRIPMTSPVPLARFPLDEMRQDE